MGNLVLNLFRVRLDKLELPDKAYVYKISFKTVDERKIAMCHARLDNTFGFVDKDKGLLYSYVSIDQLSSELRNYCELELEKDVPLNELNGDIQMEILKTYIRNTLKRDIKKILKRIEPKFLGAQRRVGNWFLSLGLAGGRVEVLNIDGQYYVVFNIKLNIRATKNLWDLVNRDIKKLKNLCWHPEKSKDVKIWFRFAPDIKVGEDTSYLLVDVKEKENVRGVPNFDQLKEYPIKSRGLTAEELKRIARYNEFDNEQPIIMGSMDLGLKKTYRFLPQYVIPAYSPVLASEKEIQEINKIKEKINFSEKKDILKYIVDSIPYLEFSSNIKLNNLEPVKLKAKFIKVKVYLDKKSGKKRISVDIESDPYEKEITSTSELFGWVQKCLQLLDGRSQEVHVSIPIPEYIPEYLHKLTRLETFLLIDVDAQASFLEYRVFEKFVSYIVGIYNIMRNVYLKLNYRAIPYLDFRKKKFVFKNSEQGVIDVSERIKKVIEGDAGLALIFGKLRDLGEDYSEIGEEYYDYYIPLKARLFRSNVLSQNFLLGKYLSEGKIDYKTIKFAVSNVVYDIFSKLGVKFIALEESIPYDYIMGVDVGYGEVYTGRVAGCTTIHDSEGRLRNIIPISKANLPSKETARIKALLEYIESSRIYDIEFKNKNILILRDGKIQQDEIEQLADFSEKRNCKIVLISVRKNTLYQVFGTNLNAFYIDLEDFYLLKAHKSKVGFSRPIKITQKVVIDKSNVSYERLTEDDIHLIYKLTALNYSFIGKISNLRTPSPIHYADKFVKAIKKGWSIEEKFLKEGLLYFI